MSRFRVAMTMIALGLITLMSCNQFGKVDVKLSGPTRVSKISLVGLPTGVSALDSVTLSVIGNNAKSYSYKIDLKQNIDCMSKEGFSSAVTISDPSTISFKSLEDGEVQICVAVSPDENGVNGRGVRLSTSTWIKESQLKPVFTSPVKDTFFLQTSGSFEIKGLCSKLTQSIKVEPADVFIQDGDCSNGDFSLKPFSLGRHETRLVKVIATGTSGNTAEATMHVGDHLVLGQPGINRNLGLLYGMATNAFSDIATDGSRLFAVDARNNRVLCWNTIPTNNQTPPDFVLGQQSLEDNRPNSGGISRSSLNFPAGVALSGNTLVVSDASNHRLLVWSPLPTTNFAPANLILGQTSVSTNSSNNGGSVSAVGLSSPQGVWTDGSVLYAADRSNNRILIWTGIAGLISGESHGSPATGVIGQTGLSLNVAGTTQTTLRQPSAVHYNLGKQMLVIADASNHRVLAVTGLASAPTSNVTPNVVLGQSSYTLGSANRGASVAANTLSAPWDVQIAGDHLFVSEFNNNRVVSYLISTLSSGVDASFVIGQDDFISNLENMGTAQTLKERGLRNPQGLSATNSSLFIGDHNRRILIYSPLPSGFMSAPNVVLGQRTFLVSGTNSSPRSDRDFVLEHGTRIGNRLFACDPNAGLLVYFDVLKSNYQVADGMYGRTDWNTGNDAATADPANSIGRCAHLTTDGKRLFLADPALHRIMVWNDPSTGKIGPPDFVLGQPSLTSIASSAGPSGMNQPHFVLVVGERVYVSDNVNNRVLTWSKLTGISGQPADAVLCQPDFASVAAGLATGCSVTRGLSFGLGQFFLADHLNQRVLVFDGLPTSTFRSPDYVIGQRNFTLNSNSSSLAYKLNGPTGVFIEAGKLLVTESSFPRTRSWTLPYTTPPDLATEAEITPSVDVYDQPTLTSSGNNFYGTDFRVNPANVFHTDERGYKYHADRFRIVVVPGDYQ